MDLSLLPNGDLQIIPDQEISAARLLDELQVSNEKRKLLSLIYKNEPVSDMNTLFPKKSRVYLRLDPSFFIDETTPVYQGALPVVYEDDWCIVVNKKPFLLVHPDGNEEDTLLSRVNAHLQSEGYPFAAQPAHRIDREASGLVFFTKYPLLQNYFDRQFENGTAVKEYLGVVDGRMKSKEIDINNPIGRNRHEANKMMVYRKGKPARTHIKRLKLHDDKTLIKADIQTGRKHQIRVHLANQGYPLFNDPLYGIQRNNKGLFLQSWRLKFKPAFSDEMLELELPMDTRFKWFKDFDLKEA